MDTPLPVGRVTRSFALPRVGDLLADKYRVLRVVADGGMGVVFEAHHELLGKSVALKFPLPELAHLPSVTERFLAEARLCARIENEHVVRVLDVSKVDGLPYIVMELVTGQSLASEMGQPWAPAKAAAYAVQMLEGLEAVHALGIVHRDVKPENVLVVVTPRGPSLKLIDFGIAKDSIAQEAAKRLTHAGAILGTPAYMAPEQIRDPLHAGSSVDLYAVGILLFEMLAGCSPFTGVTLGELAERALSGRLRALPEVAPNVPPALVALVSRATALNVPDRFATASDFKRALEPFVAGGSSTVLATLPPGSLGEPEVQLKTVLRTEPPPVRDISTDHTLLGQPTPVPTSATAPVFAPLAAAPPRTASAVRVLALGALGFIAVTALAAAGFMVLRRQRSAEQGSPPPLASFVPETDIAPLDTESAGPDASAASGVLGGVPPPKRQEAHVPTPSKEPSAEMLSVLAAESRRFHSCNSEPQPAEVTVELHIADDGSVRSVNPVSSGASAQATECVVKRSQSLQFPPHEGPDQVVRVPIQLPAASDDPEPRHHRPDWVPGRTRHRHEVE